LNGKEISEEDPKSYLKEFALGPCSPLMILPGLLNTKIVVQIDCETLKKENEEVFTTCGWTDCQKNSYEVSCLLFNQTVLESSSAERILGLDSH
jgi:hypothetical protein